MQEVESSSETHVFQIYRAMSQIRIKETLAAEYYLWHNVFSLVHVCVGQAVVSSSNVLKVKSVFYRKFR
jgi:TPP-dependent pyruvate/acetoin dehydrogenase alpha subunit